MSNALQDQDIRRRVIASMNADTFTRYLNSLSEQDKIGIMHLLGPTGHVIVDDYDATQTQVGDEIVPTCKHPRGYRVCAMNHCSSLIEDIKKQFHAAANDNSVRLRSANLWIEALYEDNVLFLRQIQQLIDFSTVLLGPQVAGYKGLKWVKDEIIREVRYGTGEP